MATKKVYDACCRMLRENAARGIKHLEAGKDGKFHETIKPVGIFCLFGRKCLVTKSEFSRCSEGEKRRHLFEDEILSAHYLKRH